MEPRYEGEYYFINATLPKEGTRAEAGISRIDAETFRKVLGNRDGWMQGKRAVKGVEVPFVIRMVEQ